MPKYTATYRDGCGTEVVTIDNDFTTLRTLIRGVTFESTDFEDWSPEASTPESDLELFSMFRGSLCAFSLDCTIPVALLVHGAKQEGDIRLTVDVGPARGNELEHLRLRVVLSCGDLSFRSPGTSSWFEEEFLALKRTMPPHVQAMSCITCAFSDYHPAGNPAFGGLACFRDKKEEYGHVKGKEDLMRLWSGMTDFVQETYLCGEFATRKPGTGYRG